jgi:hypothetical protein
LANAISYSNIALRDPVSFRRALVPMNRGRLPGRSRRGC